MFFTDTAGGNPRIGRLMDLPGRQGKAGSGVHRCRGRTRPERRSDQFQVFMVNDGIGDPITTRPCSYLQLAEAVQPSKRRKGEHCFPVSVTLPRRRKSAAQCQQTSAPLSGAQALFPWPRPPHRP